MFTYIGELLPVHLRVCFLLDCVFQGNANLVTTGQGNRSRTCHHQHPLNLDHVNFSSFSVPSNTGILNASLCFTVNPNPPGKSHRVPFHAFTARPLLTPG